MNENDARLEHMEDTIITLFVESWRFGKTFQRLVTKLDAGEQKRHESQLRWFRRKVEDALNGLELRSVDIEGQPFEPGAAATPLNVAEFEADDALIVAQMLEPIIMDKKGQVKKMGIVILRKVEQ
ncbi:MAG: hypothetical protein LBC93_06745 [Synergistaceae bacterium]|nr:hypothetical protein [Synergistaceae bacterium]